MPDAAPPLRDLAAGRDVSTRTLVVVAHPDDETIGIGGHLHLFRDLHLLHVTDGAPRDGEDARAHGFASPAAYAAARRAELHAALALAGQDPSRADTLGLPDQEAALHLRAIRDALAGRLRGLRPALVLTHAHEGGHPDHDATALAVQAACAALGPEAPAVLEMAGYHAGPDGIRTGRFLPAPGVAETALPLTPEARERKRRMLACFASQQAVLGWFQEGDAERLRPAPWHPPGGAPHPGRLFYEGFPWGMTGERFRELARDAFGKPAP